VNRTLRSRLSLSLESEEDTPVTGYKDPRGNLVKRVAVRTLLGMDTDLCRNDFAMLYAALEAAPAVHPVIEWGNLAAVDLLLGGDGSKEARRCLHAYAAHPGGAGAVSASEVDDMVLGVAALASDEKTAATARARHLESAIEPTTATPELLFLTAHLRDWRHPREALWSSVMRGIQTGIEVMRTPAAAICAYGAVMGARTAVELRGSIDRFDELAGLRDPEPSFLKAERVEVPAGESLIRLVVRAVGPTTLRLDVQQSYGVVEDLGRTLTSLKKQLDAPARRRFDKRRKDGDAILEIAVVGTPIAGEAVFSDRLLAALELLGRKGFAIRKVVTRSVPGQ
jgi:hypothetical protein